MKNKLSGRNPVLLRHTGVMQINLMVKSIAHRYILSVNHATGFPASSNTNRVVYLLGTMSGYFLCVLPITGVVRSTVQTALSIGITTTATRTGTIRRTTITFAVSGYEQWKVKA